MNEELKQKAEVFATEFDYTDNSNYENNYKKDSDKIAYESYIAGATENGIQWHDLRKDPNDLPKKNKSYWVYIDCQGNKIYRSIVWQGCWLGWNCIPLAWCEEPQFKE